MNDNYSLQAMPVPVIDLSILHQNSAETRSLVIKEIHEACRNTGIFSVINHGISETLLEEALNVSAKFFEMPMGMKEELMSVDVYKPVRFSTLQGEAQGNVRDFLKLYAHPLQDFLASWPKNPPDYREKMGMYSTQVRKLGIEIFGAIMESLKLGVEDIEQGMHIVVINSYPPSTGTSIKNVGAPPHSDHSIITILLQSSTGLQVMDSMDGKWKIVPKLKGSLQVIVGDHLEVLSNGEYHSVFHRVTHCSSNETRLSIANFLSLGIDEIVEPANELVDEDHPKLYKGSSFKDFLNHLSSGESKPFIETLKIQLHKE